MVSVIANKTASQRRLDVPALLPKQIHVWRLRRDKSVVPDLLSTAEKERIGRMRDSASREHASKSRGALRMLLAEYTGQEARELTFAYGEHGKPSLARNDAGVQFNVSHSGNIVLLAFTTSGGIGIDVERFDIGTEIDKISRRIFNETEKTELAGASLEKMMPTFFQIWTRKEAYLKARGLGIWSVDPSETEPVDASPLGSVFNFDVAPGYAAAIACTEANLGPSNVSLIDWSFE